MSAVLCSGNTNRRLDRRHIPYGYQNSSSSVHLTPPGLHVEHVVRVVLQGDDLGKVHVLVEELRTKSD